MITMTKDEEISKETIDYVSKLALLDLTDEEKEKFSKQLNDIISYFKKLESVVIESLNASSRLS